ncbi:Lipoprotein signal peptidase [hydrothermal vent metagenome]|uniref:Lipoprotein signal peptidase n=1 Tax=hydrothermal vent metagenome TaxID=652676 RepID=A0A3B1BNE8_9ZZZZ
MLKWLWLSGLVIVLDQISKYMAIHMLEMFQAYTLVHMFNLKLMLNTDASFSFLSDAGGWQRWFFTLIAVVISVVIFTWIRRLGSDQHLQAAALSLVLGGALGNVIDRLLLGHVVDFIQIYYDRWYWPAFNLADSAITLGVGLLILDSLRHKAPAKTKDKTQKLP